MTLRNCQVTFRAWNPETRCSEPAERIAGKFHGWGLEIDGDSEVRASFSVGIVEFPDGSITTVLPSDIQFDTEV